MSAGTGYDLMLDRHIGVPRRTLIYLGRVGARISNTVAVRTRLRRKPGFDSETDRAEDPNWSCLQTYIPQRGSILRCAIAEHSESGTYVSGALAHSDGAMNPLDHPISHRWGAQAKAPQLQKDPKPSGETLGCRSAARRPQQVGCWSLAAPSVIECQCR